MHHQVRAPRVPGGVAGRRADRRVAQEPEAEGQQSDGDRDDQDPRRGQDAARLLGGAASTGRAVSVRAMVAGLPISVPRCVGPPAGVTGRAPPGGRRPQDRRRMRRDPERGPASQPASAPDAAAPHGHPAATRAGSAAPTRSAGSSGPGWRGVRSRRPGTTASKIPPVMTQGTAARRNSRRESSEATAAHGSIHAMYRGDNTGDSTSRTATAASAGAPAGSTSARRARHHTAARPSRSRTARATLAQPGISPVRFAPCW